MMNVTKIVTACLVLIIGVACVDIQGPEMETLAPGDILSQVRINSSAIMIAKGDSHSVAFGVHAMNGASIPIDQDSITWSSSETQAVRVSPTGTIYGLKVSNGPVQVTVTYTYKYVTKSDTVRVYVTDGIIDANKIRLISLDSNRVGALAILGYPRVRVDLYKNDALVEEGALIPIDIDPPASTSMDITGGPNQEPVYRIMNDKSLIGKFWVRASLNLYGNEVSDSLQFTGLYTAVTSNFTLSTLSANQASSTTLLDTLPLNLYQTCALLIIANRSSDTVDIAFSDSTATSTDCAESPPISFLQFFGTPYGQFIGGNVLSMPPYSSASRQSSTRGVIVYRARKSSTKEFIPFFIGHHKQIEVEE